MIGHLWKPTWFVNIYKKKTFSIPLIFEVIMGPHFEVILWLLNILWLTDRQILDPVIHLPTTFRWIFFITLLINVLHLFVTPNSSWMISNNCLGGQGAPVYKISVPLRYFPIAVTDGSGILSRENSTHFSSGVIHSPRAGEWKFLSKRMKIKL